MMIKRATVITPTWKEFKNFKKFINMLIAAGEPKNGFTVVSDFYLFIPTSFFYSNIQMLICNWVRNTFGVLSIQKSKCSTMAFERWNLSRNHTGFDLNVWNFMWTKIRVYSELSNQHLDFEMKTLLFYSKNVWNSNQISEKKFIIYRNTL